MPQRNAKNHGDTQRDIFSMQLRDNFEKLWGTIKNNATEKRKEPRRYTKRYFSVQLRDNFEKLCGKTTIKL